MAYRPDRKCEGIAAPWMRTHETRILHFVDHQELKLCGQFEGGVYNALKAA
jgi:hypothetical protein